MRKVSLFFAINLLLLSNHFLFAADPMKFPTDKTWYSVQIKSISLPEKKKGLEIYRSLKEKGYLVYYYQTEVKQTDYMRIRVGIFETLTAAKAFGKKLQEAEGFDYYADNADCYVDNYQQQFQIITTPSAIWYKDNQQVREIFKFEKEKINRAYTAIESKAFVSPQGKEIVFFYDEKIYKIHLDNNVPIVLREEGCNSAPRWSPDGQYIAYMDCQEWEFETKLWVMQADGSNKRCLTEETKSYKVNSFLWHPRKNAIYYVWGYAYGTVSVGGSLDAITLDGNKEKVVGPKNNREEVFFEFRIVDDKLIYKLATFGDDRHNTEFTTHSIRIMKATDVPTVALPQRNIPQDRLPVIPPESGTAKNQDSVQSTASEISASDDGSVSEKTDSVNWFIWIPVIVLLLYLVYKFISKIGGNLIKTKGGLLIGAGWLPDYSLISEARRYGAFKNCSKVLCLEGPPVIDRHVAMYLYLNIEKEHNWESADGDLQYNDFNMGSGRKMWAIYPK